MNPNFVPLQDIRLMCVSVGSLRCRSGISDLSFLKNRSLDDCGFLFAIPGHTACEVISMSKKRKQDQTIDLRLDPEARICPAFDSVSVKKFAAPNFGEMGVRVLDNCAEEHIM